MKSAKVAAADKVGSAVPSTALLEDQIMYNLPGITLCDTNAGSNSRLCMSAMSDIMEFWNRGNVCRKLNRAGDYLLAWIQ
jgi:hypothetical protein